MEKFKHAVIKFLTFPIRVVVWPYLWLYVRNRRNWGHYPSCPLDRWLISKGHVVKVKGDFPWEGRDDE